jgi:hypothetical protein
MPRLIPDKHCPHCRVLLPVPKPRACPNCGGSLNQRYLKIGCLTSAPPPLVLLALGAWAVYELLGSFG